MVLANKYFKGGFIMKKIFILSMLLVLSCGYAYGWEMYVSNEYSSQITVYNQQGVLIDTITDPLIQSPRQLAFRGDGILYVACIGGSKIVKINQNHNVIGYIQTPQNTLLLWFGNREQ